MNSSAQPGPWGADAPGDGTPQRVSNRQIPNEPSVRVGAKVAGGPSTRDVPRNTHPTVDPSHEKVKAVGRANQHRHRRDVFADKKGAPA